MNRRGRRVLFASCLLLPSSACRSLAVAVVLLAGALAPVAVSAQEAVSPLPPPVTRALYRSHWFEFLNSLLEDDEASAAQSLTRMRRAAQAVGVRYLSDFSRAAVYQARQAERLGQTARAGRAYDAAVALDDTSYDALASKMGFLLRQRRVDKALALLPDVAASLLRTREARLAFFSSVALWAGFAAAAATLGWILILLARHGPRLSHDLWETARRHFGPGAVFPLALLAFGLPLAAGLGPVWVLLWWGVLIFTYAEGRERAVLAGGYVLLGLLPLLLDLVGRENIIRRSPLSVAAVDLEEQREDGSAEDGLKQASAVFAEDSEVWFLLGMYAQRAGDTERAIASYNRAVQADPKDYRAFINRGNVHFEEGDYGAAIRDYLSAAERNPRAAEAYYNLSVARGESYDFDGQAKAIAQARLISEAKVNAWSSRLTLSRVVPAPYPVSRARRRIEEWNDQPKSRRLPGHLPADAILTRVLSPLTLGPLAALLAAAILARVRGNRGFAGECQRCGAPFCARCKRRGDTSLYCAPCVSLHLLKEDAGIEAHVAQTREAKRRARARDRVCRLVSLLLPGTHACLVGRPFRGLAALLGFVFAAGAAAIGWRLFDPRPLAPRPVWGASTVVALAAVLFLWLPSNVAAWRRNHGS